MSLLTIEREMGTGRPFVVCRIAGEYEELLSGVCEQLSQRNKVYVVSFPKITHSNWQPLAEELENLFQESRIRQPSIISLGECCVPVQCYLLDDYVKVRRLVLVEATTRPEYGLKERVADKIEELLPLGLPLRLSSVGFNARPYLQRLRCPTLVACFLNSSEKQKSESVVLANSIPTAWSSEVGDVGALVEAIEAFENVEPKASQKNRKVAANS